MRRDRVTAKCLVHVGGRLELCQRQAVARAFELSEIWTQRNNPAKAIATWASPSSWMRPLKNSSMGCA